MNFSSLTLANTSASDSWARAQTGGFELALERRERVPAGARRLPERGSTTARDTAILATAALSPG